MRKYVLVVLIIVVLIVAVSVWSLFNVYPAELSILREEVKPGMMVEEVHNLVPGFEPTLTDRGDTPGGDPLLYEFYFERGHEVKVVYQNGRVIRLSYEDSDMSEPIDVFDN